MILSKIVNLAFRPKDRTLEAAYRSLGLPKKLKLWVVHDPRPLCWPIRGTFFRSGILVVSEGTLFALSAEERASKIGSALRRLNEPFLALHNWLEFFQYLLARGIDRITHQGQEVARSKFTFTGALALAFVLPIWHLLNRWVGPNKLYG